MTNYTVIRSYFKDIFNEHSYFSKPLTNLLLAVIVSCIKIRSCIPTFVGRDIASTVPRYGVKKIHRLFKNKFLKVELLNSILLSIFLKIIFKLDCIKLVIDWTVVRRFNFLSVSLVNGFFGRTIPIYFAGYVKGDQGVSDSQPDIEKRVLSMVFRYIPSNMRVIILADRGFDAPDTLEFISEHGYEYVIRAKTQTCFYTAKGRIKKITFRLVKKRGFSVYRNIEYTKARRVKTNLYCLWQECQEEPWLLLSNINMSTPQIIGSLYAERMKIEEMFKSFKNEHTGFDIKQVRLRHLDRWLRFLAVSSLLFHALGMLGEKLHQIAKIEHFFSLSSKPPKGQKIIFSIYTLAAMVLNCQGISMLWKKKRWFVCFTGYNEVELD
jgi:hypothetical protein